MTTELQDILAQYQSISLEEMGKIRLMNRLDTKYVTTTSALIPLLHLAAEKYQVQVVNEENLVEYQTTYLDTPDKAMYIAHHNGRKVREKIRVRTYISSHLTFLEVKNKDNHGRTDKKRTRIHTLTSIAQDGGDEFLQKYSWYNLNRLQPQMMNHFWRITLVDKARTERLTIDTELSFHNMQNEHSAGCGKMVIIELKRNGRNISAIEGMLHDLHVSPINVSKYCLGTVLTDSSIKHNRFKPVLMKINKIIQNDKDNGYGRVN
jgi:hypothetical protein